MIVLFRVDHRLLHGQVVFSWTSALKPDCILVANDDVASDELRKTTLRLSKPNDVKLVIKSIDDSIAAINGGKTDKYHLMIVVSNVADATRMALAVEQISAIDLGGTKPTDETKQIAKSINLTDEDIALLKNVQDQGIEVYIQGVPSDKKVPFSA